MRWYEHGHEERGNQNETILVQPVMPIKRYKQSYFGLVQTMRLGSIFCLYILKAEKGVHVNRRKKHISFTVV